MTVIVCFASKDMAPMSKETVFIVKNACHENQSLILYSCPNFPAILSVQSNFFKAFACMLYAFADSALIRVLCPKIRVTKQEEGMQ